MQEDIDLARLSFALRCVAETLRGQDKNCPYCGSGNTTLIQRKKLLLQLMQCHDCHLMFRWPKDNERVAGAFYQSDYQESVVTDLPSRAELDALLRANFANSLLSYAQRIATVRSLRPAGRLLDYGASWGYGVRQFQDTGYDAVGYEISLPRARYGREALGVSIESDISRYADREFDIIHTAHVLEHMPDCNTAFRAFKRLLKSDGVLVIFVPNAGGALAKQLGVGWGPLIGEKHALALTAEFFDRGLAEYAFDTEFAASPYDIPPAPVAAKPALGGEELLVIGRPTKDGSQPNR